MCRTCKIALCLALAAGLACGRQVSPSNPQPQLDAQLKSVKVYSAGPDVTAPELLPLNLPPLTVEKCKEKVDGTVELSLLVDETGRPRNIMFLHPLGTDLDKFALRIAGADQFKPGIRDGKPVVVAESLHVKLQSCFVESKGDAGDKTYALKLRSAPEQELAALASEPDGAVLAIGAVDWIDSGISNSNIDSAIANSNLAHVGGRTKAPVPLTTPEATYTDAARKAKINGVCNISLIVDRQGMPQNLRVVKSLDPGLDQNALVAVSRYRFKPAMRDGEPVPVMVIVEVNFKLW